MVSLILCRVLYLIRFLFPEILTDAEKFEIKLNNLTKMLFYGIDYLIFTMNLAQN
jgi:hypothetical protein